jgi:hypothetical protein
MSDKYEAELAVVELAPETSPIKSWLKLISHDISYYYSIFTWFFIHRIINSRTCTAF